jgi:uncharacterized protein (DUF4415 family)
MRKDGNTKRASATEVRNLLKRGGDRSDWQAAREMSQAEVERLADEEDGPLSDGWEDTVQIGLPPRKKAIHMRIDVDVLEWFKAQGDGYQTRINAVLRSFVQSRRKNASQSPK